MEHPDIVEYLTRFPIDLPQKFPQGMDGIPTEELFPALEEYWQSQYVSFATSEKPRSWNVMEVGKALQKWDEIPTQLEKWTGGKFEYPQAADWVVRNFLEGYWQGDKKPCSQNASDLALIKFLLNLISPDSPKNAVETVHRWIVELKGTDGWTQLEAYSQSVIADAPESEQKSLGEFFQQLMG